MLDFTNRIEGTVFGIAFGDGIAAPSATNRLGILAPKRIMRMRSLSEYADENMHTTRPIPYTHAQAGALLNPSPSDDTEWFAFVLKYLSEGQTSLKAWQDLSKQREQIRARTGTKIALKNLANGLTSPESGHDNPHYFDDISLIRAVAIALIFYSNNEKMLAKVEEDVTVTHSEDGLYCAKAVANLFAEILRGASKEDAIKSALRVLPEDSWSDKLVHDALAKANQIKNTFARTMVLEEQFIENIYAYPISAPETLGLLLAHFANTESPEDLVSSTLNHKRKLDSLPPLAGALAGAFYGSSWLPKNSVSAEINIDGVCIPALRGTKVRQLVDLINQSHK